MVGKKEWSAVQEDDYATKKAGEIKFLKSIDKTQEYFVQYYEEGWRAKEEGTKKICWVGHSFPIEILFAFDVMPFFPEFSGVMACFERKSTPFQMAAEAHGYDIELCSVARTHFGELIKKRTKEEGAMPQADFLCATRSECMSLIWWWDAYKRQYNLPLHCTEVPQYQWNLGEKIPQHHVDYFATQMKGLIRFLEEQTGTKFDQDKYREIVKLSNRTHELWAQILDYGQTIPSPYSSWDLFTPLMAISNWRGLQMAVDLFEHILKEVKFRVDNKIAALPDERFRLFFNGNPSWYNFQYVPALLAKRGAIFVCDHTNHIFEYLSDIGSGSFEELAQCLPRAYVNGGLISKTQDSLRLCREYKVDGSVMQDNRGCRQFAFGFYEIIEALEKELGIPSLVYESNSADMRFWSDEEIRSKLDAFLDILEQRAQT